MLRVPIVHAKAGMTLAMPVQHPDRADTVLLREGVELTQQLITRLRQIRCREVWIEFPGLEEICQFVRPEIQQEHARVAARIDEAMQSVREEWSPRLDYLRYRDAMQGLIQNLIDHPQAAIFASELVSASRPALRHASTVSLLSVLIGLSLDFYLICERSRLRAHHARDVSSLGIGAMLHDIGLLRLDEEARSHFEQTGDEEDPRVQEHVHLGYRLVRPCVDAAAATVVLHHHQRFDAGGYPRRRVDRGRFEAPGGRDIHVLARICACADLFDKIRWGVGSDPLPTVRVLSMMRRSPIADWIDPVVLIGLQHVVPAFAPGSIVRLSTGAEAVVVDTSPLEPCRPKVRIITSLDPRDGVDATTIDLRAERDLTIVEVDGEDVREDLFDVSSLEELDLAVLSRRISREHSAASR